MLPTISSDWLLDSSASQHITSDLNALSLHAPYNGNEELLTSYGTFLPITHADSIHLHTLTFIFALINLPCVPRISCNILSLSQLCLDNPI